MIKIVANNQGTFPPDEVYPPSVTTSTSVYSAIDAIKEATATIARLTEWSSMSDSEMRLRCGELTTQEIRTVRAVLRAIIGEKTL